MLKNKIIVISFIGIISGQSFDFHPATMSAIVPGWGESKLLNKKRSRFFFLTEITLWTTCLSAYSFSYHQENQYKTFAVKHAGLLSDNKDHKFWVDIGNYLNLEDHNDEHLRWREMEASYTEDSYWNWDSKKNMEKFESMRINSDLLALRGKFIIGTIVVNHIVSAINALYLERLGKLQSISVLPYIDKNQQGIMLNISF